MSETNEEMERDFAEFRESQAMSARVSRTIAERMRVATPPTPDLDAVREALVRVLETAHLLGPLCDALDLSFPQNHLANKHDCERIADALLAAVSRPAEARGVPSEAMVEARGKVLAAVRELRPWDASGLPPRMGSHDYAAAMAKIEAALDTALLAAQREQTP